MKAFSMSEIAYKEFLKFLEQNNVPSKSIRINLAGHGCGGPVFNIVLDEQRANDEVTKIEDLTFLVDKDLIAQFGGFTLTCDEENGLGGFDLQPLLRTDDGGGCSTCSGCH
ncbi:MAG: HesB-like protein [Clostridiaceae bacterium]